jgi:hypothetical protein
MAASLRRGPQSSVVRQIPLRTKRSSLDRYGEGTNILALKQDRFNETYLQVTDFKMVGETGMEIAGYPHAAMAFILQARITLRSHK